MANENSAKTLANPPRVINMTQLKNGSLASDSEKWVETSCIQYSAEANVIVVPDSVTVDSPAIKHLLDAVLDEGHIHQTLLRPLNSKLSCNMNRPFYYPQPSQYRGVIKCASDRFEAFAWENTALLASRGRPVYIGGYSSELEAAKAHDLISLRMGGASFSHTNFPIKNYWKEIDEMRSMSKRDYINLIRRRKATGFSGSDCDFRGVVRTNGGGSRQWQAWLGRDKLDLPKILLGSYLSAEDAGRALDIAVIGFKGADAVTNFDLSSYDVMGIMGRLPNHSTMSSAPPPPQLSNSTPTPSSSYQSNQTPDDGLSGGFFGTSASPLSNNSSSPAPFLRDSHQQNPFDFGGFLNGGADAPHWSISSSSPSPSSFEVHQNTNNGTRSSPCDLAGNYEYQHSNLPFSGGDQNSIDISCALGGLSDALSQLNISSYSPSSNHGGLIATGGYQQGNLPSLPSSFEGYQNPINNIQRNPFDFGGYNTAISQPSPLPSSFGLHQGSSCNPGGLIGTGFQQTSNFSLPQPSFQGYQNSDSIQRSHQSSDSSSFLSMIQNQGYPNSSHTQSNSGGGATGTRFQPSSQSSLVSSLQGYQSRPYDVVGRVIRPRSQLGLNSTRIQSSPYEMTRARSPLINTSTTPTSAPRNPFSIGDVNRTQATNMGTLLPSPSHNCLNPNNIQSSLHHSSGGNYGTSIGGNGPLDSNQKCESLLNSLLLPSNQSQSQSSILSSQGNKDQNQIGSTSSGKLPELPSDFGKRLLGAGGNYTSAFSWRLPRMMSEASSSGTRAGGTGAANNYGGLGSFILSSNNVINNHVDVNVTPPPVIPQWSEPAFPPQQQPALVVQSHGGPNSLAAYDLNPQNTHQHLNNNSSFSSFSPLSPPESNAGGGSGGFISEMIGNNDDDDFDIAKYLDKSKTDEDFSRDVEAWLKMDVDEGL